MGRPKLLGFTLLLLAYCLNPAVVYAADSQAPVVAPRGIPEDVWNSFYKIAFTAGAISDSNLKWGSQPTLGLLGNPSEEDLMTLTNLSAGLRKYCPNLAPSVAKNDSGAGIKMYFVPKSEYSKYIEKAPSDANSYLNYIYYTSGGLRSVTTVINSELASLAERKNLISVRFLQSLGLMTYSNDKSLAMLSYLYLNDGIYSNNDAQVLTLFCSNYVTGGQNFKSVASEIAAVLNKSPNQSPVFSPTISVEPSESNARAFIWLGSPQNLFTSGEMNLEYTVTTGGGEIVDSGGLSNSTSRLKSNLEIEISNLDSGNLYKFNLTLRNIIGTSKIFSTNFKTTGERSQKSATSQEASDGAEQSISLFDLPTSVKLSEKTLSLVVNASSGLEPYAESLTPTICTVESLEINFLKAGKCEFKLSQDGDEDFLPAEDVIGSFTIQGPRTTITCVKGKLTKKVTGTSPKCPSGYKKKVWATGKRKCVLEISQWGDSIYEKASRIIEFTTATKFSNIQAKITPARKSWASWIVTYDYISGANPLQSNKLTNIKVNGMCNKGARSVQAWKNTDPKGKRNPNGSRPAGQPWICRSSGSFEGNIQVSGGSRFYIVDVPTSRVGTQIEFRVDQEIVGTEYVNYK